MDGTSQLDITGSMVSPGAETSIPDRTKIERVAYLLVGLTAFVALLAVAGLVAGIFWLTGSEHSWAAMRILAVTGPLALGATGCGLLLGALACLRRLERLGTRVSELAQSTTLFAEAAAKARVPQQAPPGIDPQMVYRSLAQIEEILLLPDDHRQRRYQSRMAVEIQRGLSEIERLAVARSFYQARERLALLVARFGPEDRLREAQVRLARLTESAQAEDTRQTAQDIKQLMLANRWEEAEQAARELADNYPGAATPLSLIEQVCRERQVYEQRNRQRLHDEIQQQVNQRKWQDAARAARQFIATFPIGIDTEALKAQLETLDANAEIQKRQELEQIIKDKLREQRYWDALDLARRIIAEFPFSPQAKALSGQLARIEELARTQVV